ncbi:hypothetical protein [Rhizobium leguminosarum]|uniref:hypothetical protein n=1 Tax=Rhizobium leguminosarum TaxID=384 RepID=UPI000484DB1E|nr:hypothetical protein [Rhizobium leguminosarum]
MVGNRIRIFSELVSVDAWYPQFTASKSKVSLHADITFHTAHLGGEHDSPVNFTLDLRRAELRVIVPETEPIGFERASVARFDEGATATRKTKSTFKSKARLDAALGLAVGRNRLTSGAASMSAGVGKDVQRTEEITAIEKLKKIVVTHSVDAEGNNRWHFKPAIVETLEGKPWTARNLKLMKLVDQRQAVDSRFEPTVRLELSCLREDLRIGEIRLRDQGLFAAAMSKVGGERRMQAAAAYIRNRIAEEGLPSPHMDNDHAQIILAELSAAQE